MPWGSVLDPGTGPSSNPQCAVYTYSSRGRHHHRQMDMCHRAIGKFANLELFFALLKQISDLRPQILGFIEKEGGLFYGYDYIMTAEPENLLPSFAKGSA